MSELLRNAVSGWQRYTDSGKYAVLFLGVLLAFFYLWANEEQRRAAEQKKEVAQVPGKVFVVYGVVTAILVACPLTAVMLMKYQTRFYDYEWTFSLVPITAVIAYGAVYLGWEYFGRKCQLGKQQKYFGCAAAACLLLTVIVLCGNLGKDSAWNDGKVFGGQSVAESEEKVRILLDKLRENGDNEDIFLWAPKEIMMGVRGVTGEITLLYGRNMWDAALNAYAYDTYDSESTALYQWMESLPTQVSRTYDTGKGITKQDKDMQQLYFEVALNRGVNCMVFPESTVDYVEESLKGVVKQAALQIEEKTMEGYRIYRIRALG